MTSRRERDCRALIERLSRYIDDDLRAPARRAVLRHLRRCPCCDDFVASLERTVRICREAGRVGLPRAVRARAAARIRRLIAQPTLAAARASERRPRDRRG